VLAAFLCCIHLLRVKYTTMTTVEIPNTDPNTGPAIQVELRGGGEDAGPVVGFDCESAVAVPVWFANAEVEALHAIAG
jgi:hypothetical protein